MERISTFSVFRKLNGNLGTAEINELSSEDFLPERLFHDLSIVISDTKANQRSDVSKDGLPNLRRKLIDELMREPKGQPILAGFRENGRKRFGGKVLELIDEEVKVFAFLFGNIG